MYIWSRGVKCYALGVKIGSTDLDLENVPTIRTLRGCSLGLITAEASSSTVRLVHLTLQEYLSNNLFKCVNSEHDLFYMDNTRQVWGCCQGMLSEEG